jgi:hypothetical protein
MFADEVTYPPELWNVVAQQLVWYNSLGFGRKAYLERHPVKDVPKV